MRRKLLHLDNISNYQKINQIFSHEININKKIKKVTNLDTNVDSLDKLSNIRQYRFKYVFIPSRGKSIIVNSANLMKYGFFYSTSEQYEYVFTNPTYELLVYIPLIKEYYIKVNQTIWQKQFKDNIDLKYSICSLNKENPLLTGDIYNEYQDTNISLLHSYYFENIFENEIQRYITSNGLMSSQYFERLLNDREVRYKLYNVYKDKHIDDAKFKCQYLINDKNNNLYATINVQENIDNKILINVQDKLQIAKNKFFAVLLLRQLKEN